MIYVAAITAAICIGIVAALLTFLWLERFGSSLIGRHCPIPTRGHKRLDR